VPVVALACHLNSEARPCSLPSASKSLCDCSSYSQDTKIATPIDVGSGNHTIIMGNPFGLRYSQSHDAGQEVGLPLHFS
jgi:hypothetical protein